MDYSAPNGFDQIGQSEQTRALAPKAAHAGLRFVGFGFRPFPTSSLCWRGGVASTCLSAASRLRSVSSSE